MSLVQAQGVWKEFTQPGHDVVALHDINLEIQPGEFMAITGESGSGKSTLLSLLAALDRQSRGKIWLLGQSLESTKPGRLARIRCENVGFIFQDFKLVRHLSVLDNVRLPLFFSSRARDTGFATELIERFNMGHRLRHKPRALSRGEMQRVALARALVNKPVVLYADEPTANLDRRNSEIIWNYFKDLNRTENLSIIVATHNMELEREATRVVRLVEGRIVSDEVRK